MADRNYSRQHRSAVSLPTLVLAGAWAFMFCQVTTAQQGWTYTILHPPGADSSRANATTDIQQVGQASFAGELHAGLWNGTAESWVDLHPAGATESESVATTGTYQAGHAIFAGAEHAGTWDGTPGSWTDLNPDDWFASLVKAATNEYQAGGVSTEDYAVFHACIWTGTPDSFQDLHPDAGWPKSFVIGATDCQQVGWVRDSSNVHACRWNGTPESFVDLHPAAGWPDSVAADTAGDQQAGWFGEESVANYACIWSGTAESFVNLHPDGASKSIANATTGTRQAGHAQFDGQWHAGTWRGTPETWVDLHALLPSDYTSSVTGNIYEADGKLYVPGRAWNETLARWEAILWTGPVSSCPADVNGDGYVDIDDIFAVLAAWGPCP